jgi:hypothetical protein
MLRVFEVAWFGCSLPGLRSSGLLGMEMAKVLELVDGVNRGMSLMLLRCMAESGCRSPLLVHGTLLATLLLMLLNCRPAGPRPNHPAWFRPPPQWLVKSAEHIQMPEEMFAQKFGDCNN